jgi:hypothetical protein
MKKILTITLFISLFQSNISHAESSVSISGVGYIFGIYNIAYQQSMSEKTAFTVGLSTGTETYFDGFAISGSYKKYWEQAGSGPYHRFGLAYLAMNPSSTTIEAVYPIILVGTERKIDKHLSYSIEGGPGSTVGYTMFTANLNYKF